MLSHFLILRTSKDNQSDPLFSWVNNHLPVNFIVSSLFWASWMDKILQIKIIATN